MADWCPDEELATLAEKANESLRAGGDLLLATIPHLVDEIQRRRGWDDGTTRGVDRDYHDRVAKSRRAWMDAATVALPADWMGTPDDLRAEMLRQADRIAELEAEVARLRAGILWDADGRPMSPDRADGFSAREVRAVVSRVPDGERVIMRVDLGDSVVQVGIDSVYGLEGGEEAVVFCGVRGEKPFPASETGEGVAALKRGG